MPVLAAIAYGAHKSAVYQASAQVVISRQNLANALTGTPDATLQTNDFLAVVTTQSDIARTPTVATRVLAAVPGSGLTYKQFLSESSIDTAPEADTLTFHASSGNRGLAVRLTNAYATQFVAYRRELDTASLNLALTQLDQQIRSLGANSANAGLVAQLNTRAQELQTLIALQTSNATVTSTALDASKIAPNPSKYVALAIAVGILLAIALAAAAENLDTRVRKAEDVEAALRVPFLAHLSPPSPKLGGRLLMLEDPRAPEAEAYRVLRTNLQLATLDRSVKTIMITSARDLEGKSTTIANLAVTMAKSGTDVVLVDVDLRRPTLTQKFGLPPGPGLTDVALGRIDVSEALEEIDISSRSHQATHTSPEGRGSLRVLRSGPLPPDPGEFVHSPSVRALFGRLSQTADIVLIDTPPLLFTGDAAALSPAVDAMFLVARLPQLRQSALKALARALHGCSSTVLGFVATGQGEDVAGYGYGYGYEEEPQQQPPAPATAEPDLV